MMAYGFFYVNRRELSTRADTYRLPAPTGRRRNFGAEVLNLEPQAKTGRERGERKWLTSRHQALYSAFMRTTVTIDDELADRIARVLAVAEGAGPNERR